MVGGVQQTQAHPCHGPRGGGANAVVGVVVILRRSSDGSCQTNRGRRRERKGRLAVAVAVAVAGWVELGSVARLGRDQRLTNDVYAVVLVDICWQNRSPVRHLEWN